MIPAQDFSIDGEVTAQTLNGDPMLFFSVLVGMVALFLILQVGFHCWLGRK